MSVSSDLPETLWWTQQPPMMESTPKTPTSKHKSLISQPTSLWSNSQLSYHQSTTTTPMRGQNSTVFNFNLNQEDNEELDEDVAEERENLPKDEQEDNYQQEEIQKEAMFEKPLTPSDVGKLNRLVIPKQYAEKYFPLGGGGGGGEKGLLLSFEDESGKSWRFRYSYWNSSQSYVLTKGWSRFVKEKRLDAGDVVLFERHRGDADRHFIGWRRRSALPVQDNGVAQLAVVATNGGGGRVFYSAPSYPSHPNGPPLPYQPDCPHAGSTVQNQTTPSGNSKRLRLFGVNLECQADESEPITPDGSPMSSQGQGHHYQYYSKAHASNYHNHMDIDYSSRDVDQVRHYQG